MVCFFNVPRLGASIGMKGGLWIIFINKQTENKSSSLGTLQNLKYKTKLLKASIKLPFQYQKVQKAAALILGQNIFLKTSRERNCTRNLLCSKAFPYVPSSSVSSHLSTKAHLSHPLNAHRKPAYTFLLLDLCTARLQIRKVPAGLSTKCRLFQG